MTEDEITRPTGRSEGKGGKSDGLQTDALVARCCMIAMSLDSLMSPVTECMDAVSLRAIADLRANPEAAQRMEWLAERANEGRLTPEERSEYESCVQFAGFLGVLQSKARRKLKTVSGRTTGHTNNLH